MARGDRSTAKKNKQQTKKPLTAEDLTSLLPLLVSATSLSLRFLSDHDLLLLPSQTLTLDSSLRSSALSISHLLSLLPFPPHSLQTLTLDSPKPPPSISPPSSWFLRFLSSSSSNSSDPRWLETFRMSKPSFYLLLQTLTPSLQSNSNSNSNSSSLPLPPDHKLGAALFRLAHAAPFSAVARRFGLDSPALACRAFYEVCKAVADQLGHLFELSSDLKRVSEGFNWMSLPNCCGVLGFARFFVEGDIEKGGSVIAQGLVDSEGRFLDVSAGWPGSMNPHQIITKTKLYSVHASLLASGPPLELGGDGVLVPRYLLGDSCCPLLPWLLTPFPNVDSGSKSSKCEAFNSVHSQGMELVDRAFGRVRSRWQLLRTRWRDECIEALPFVIVASCLLHNYLIKCSEPVADEMEVRVKEERFPRFEGKGSEGGERIREALASHLSLSTVQWPGRVNLSVEKNPIWTDAMDDEFLEAMVEQCEKGRKVAPGGFHKDGWVEILARMNAKFGHERKLFDKNHLSSRMETFDTKYSMMKQLLNQSGFEWNCETKMLTAAQEVWNAYIMAHPELSAYRMERLPDYESLCTIFANGVADGNCARSPLEGNPPLGNIIHQEVNRDDSVGLDNNPIVEEVEGCGFGSQHSPNSTKRRYATPSSLRASRGNVGHEILGGMDTFCQTLAGYTTSTKLQEKVMLILDQLKTDDNFTEEIYFDACCKLTDEKLARTFLALSPENRKGFVMHISST